LYNLIPSLTARENVSLVSEISDDPMRPEDALEMVGLGNRLDHVPAQLSGGEQQRVAIARAVATHTVLRLAGGTPVARHVQPGGRCARRPGHPHEQRRDQRRRGQRLTGGRGGHPLVTTRLRTLDRKMLRELWRLRAQLLSIGLVVATAVVTVVTLRGTYEALYRARSDYYERYRLADIWSSLERAPEA